MIPPVTTCKKKTYSPSSSWKNWPISLAKPLTNTLISPMFQHEQKLG